MERRTITAFLLIIAFYIIWAQFTPEPVSERDSQTIEREEVTRERRTEPFKEAEAITADRQDPASTLPPLKAENIAEVKIGNYYIIYSRRGGYIREVAVDTPENILPFKNLGFQPATQDIEYDVQAGKNSLVFLGEENERKGFIFSDYLIEIEGVSPSSILLFSFYLDSGVSHIDQRYFEAFYKKNDDINRTHPKKISEEMLSDVEFAGFRSKYDTAVLLRSRYSLEWAKEEDIAHLYLQSPPSAISLYVGPHTADRLSPYGLESIVYYGFWHFLAVALIKILYFFHGFLHNWGLSIMLLSFSAHLFFFPLTAKSSKAMRKMQEIQPLMQELREKHKDKPQKLQKETVELYKKHQVNPLGGCLPLFFQFPIFIAFYQVVFRFAELQGASFLWIQDLSRPDRLFRLPFTVPLLRVEYFNLLPVLLVILGIIQQHVTVASSNPQQKKMGLFMGVFMGVIFYNFPSALVIYFFVQNLLTLAYQFRLKKAKAAS